MQPERRSVLVTHADEPLGRRLVKHLYYDESVSRIMAIGSGPPPQDLDRFLSGAGRVDYLEVDLTRHRHVADLFHGGALRSRRIDTVVFVPTHAPAEKAGHLRLSGVPERTTEARLVLQHCLELGSIHQLIALGSAFVYRLVPGNANRFDEHSALDFDPDLPAVTRSWIDCDMLLHAEIHNERLAVALLRVPTVVGRDGGLFLHPGLSTRGGPALRAMGFDPMCALVADQDVCRAVVLALRKRAAGTFNIAGRESVPLSVLTRWAGGSSRPIPGPILGSIAGTARFLGADDWRAQLGGPHVRYGFSLDTRLAERELGYRSLYRISPGKTDHGRPRIETTHA